MSGTGSNIKLNSNLISNSIVTETTAISTKPQKNNSKTYTSDEKLFQSQLQTQTQQQTQIQQKITSNSNKFLTTNQQQQQRRSLLPPPNHHQQNQNQPTASTLSTATTTNNFKPHLNQLQTVATIHHQHTQPQTQQTNTESSIPTTTSTLRHQDQTQLKTLPPSAPQTESNSTSASKISTPQVSSHSYSRRILNHFPGIKTSRNQQHQINNIKIPLHAIPPRYQPPPQPQPQQQHLRQTIHNTEISKHLNSYPPSLNHLTLKGNNINSATLANSKNTPFGESSHLKLKYPPDIPQLSAVYIPDSFKNHPNSEHILQEQRQFQQQSQQPNQKVVNSLHDKQDMLKFVRKPEPEHPSPNTSVASSGSGIPATTSTRLTAEQNRQLQSLINELRSLKDQNQRLLDENQELRDLCCFLDDDRQKGRKLAREWQRFGRYTASVMRQEVSAYQNKLRQLDDKQQELITDNLELKELCLYLDEERAHIAANALCPSCAISTRNNLRDDGDGSSSTTNYEHNYDRQIPDQLRSSLNDQTLLYVRSLERRIQQLEEERIRTTTPTPSVIAQQQEQHHQKIQQKQAQQQQQLESLPEPLSGRPEAVVRALQVLEVREQLERERTGSMPNNAIDQMDDGEKALVREMCNVVWRKLEGTPNGPSHSIEPI